MRREKITDGWFVLRENVNRQLLTEKNAKYIFSYLGKQIMSAIKRDKMVIPKENFIADIHIKFMTENEYENKKPPLEEE